MDALRERFLDNLVIFANIAYGFEDIGLSDFFDLEYDFVVFN